MHGRDDSALIEIRSRAFVNTLIDRLSTTDGYRVKSRAVTVVQSLPYGADVRYELNLADRREVETFVAAVGDGTPRRRHVDFWIIALAIIGGCLLLLLIVALLWKCGFFRRRHPNDDDDVDSKNVPLYKATKASNS